ncbi:MAG TPA: MarR family transcriptional regulator [Verrucomicrobiae bacterium]|jgi:DNA-binding MarR family transcriptional regulator|nr:MarR family transcriptional regulator [Verrucomicrobiae bacterium]
MNEAKPWYEEIVLPALLRHARAVYGIAMRAALAEAGFDDIPKNGLYVIGGLALGAGDVPLGQLVEELAVSKQAAGQLVDTLVLRGYLERAVDTEDRRKLTVTLTERGKAAAATQTVAREKIDAELLARMGGEAIHLTRQTLAVLINLGQEQRKNQPPHSH